MSDSQEKLAASPLKAFRALFAGRALKPGAEKLIRAEKAPKIFADNVSGAFKTKAWHGYKRQGMGGTESILAYLPMMAIEKMFGKSRTREAIWKHVHAPSLKADTAVGGALGKIPGAKGLFTTTEKVPWGHPDKKLFREIERSSALAPLTKIKDIGAPIVVGVGLEKGLGKAIDMSRGKKDRPMNQDMREKVASTMLSLHSENKEHTKRAHATRLLFKKAEMGLEQVPQNFGELEEKLASLMTQDLIVVEKALELAGGHLKLGELDSVVANPLGATEKFQAAILGDEI